MHSNNIFVTGNGLAALIARFILKHPFVSSKVIPEKKSDHYVLLKEDSGKLLCKLFNTKFSDIPGRRVSHRLVHWGQNKKELIEQPGIVIKMPILINFLSSKFGSNKNASFPIQTYQLSSVTSNTNSVFKFGEREIVYGNILLTSQIANNYTVFVRSYANGWLYVAPTDEHNIFTVQRCYVSNSVYSDATIMDEVRVLLNTDCYLEQSVFNKVSTNISWYPECWDDNCVFFSNASLTYDPICGDGIGNAIRNTLWAVALINYAASGSKKSAAEAKAFYRLKISNDFKIHFRAAYDHYSQILSINNLAKQFPLNVMRKAQTNFDDIYRENNGRLFTLDMQDTNTPKLKKL